MTTVTRFSRQNDAGLRALNVFLRENLVLVVVLVLESEGPYFTFATRRHILRTREFNLIPSPLTESAVLNEGRVLVLNQSNYSNATPPKHTVTRTAACRSHQFSRSETTPKCSDSRRTVKERTIEHLTLTVC